MEHINFNALHESPETIAKIWLLRDKLEYLGIKVDLLEIKTGNILRIRVEQTDIRNGLFLSQSQLAKRARTVFEPLENRYKLHLVTLTHKPNFESIDFNWVRVQMKVFKLKEKDILKQVALDESTWTLFKQGNRDLTKSQKVAFFYYFLTYHLNRRLRTKDSKSEEE